MKDEHFVTIVKNLSQTTPEALEFENNDQLDLFKNNLSYLSLQKDKAGVELAALKGGL
jgi:hypothetical protein